MFAICIESSHQRGMGHLFRALNLISQLRKMGIDFFVVINNDTAAIGKLKEWNIPFEIAALEDVASNWETTLIKKHQVQVWVNDRLETSITHSKHVKENSISLVSIDDIGEGATFADINFIMMPCFYESHGKGLKVLKGLEYFILNDEVSKYRRIRSELRSVVVSLGGSDTYGVTMKIAKSLIRKKIKATIVIGPSFIFEKELLLIAENHFQIKQDVPSLLAEFNQHDMAITGGGITPFEANASGLPCIIIASEQHEIENGKFLEKQGSSIFAGYYSEFDYDSLFDRQFEIGKMSIAGTQILNANGAQNVINEIMKL